MTTLTQSNRAHGAMTKMKLMFAAMLMMIGLQAKAEKKVYTEFVESTGTLTYYYDDQMSSRSGMVEEYDLDKLIHFESYGTTTSKITKAVVDESMKDARYSSLRYLFSSQREAYELNALKSIEGLENLNTALATSMEGMFSGCSSLISLDLSSFNTAKVKDMFSMFGGCSSLTSLNFSSFNTANATTMESMFENCSALTSLTLSSFNTANVKNMNEMFSGCSSLISLTLSSSFNTANVKSMNEMFKGCSSLTTLDLSNFNTANVTEMSEMFKGCSSLTSLDLSNFKTTNVKYMKNIFEGCSALTSLNIMSFTVENLLRAESMFANCGNLKTLICKTDWSRASFVDDDMFKGCSKLKGGRGTICDGKNHIDKSYARPDFGAVIPGYFTSDIELPKMVYTVLDESTGTLTYYYDDQYNTRTGLVDVYDQDNYLIHFESYGTKTSKITKAVVDESMKDARYSSLCYLFSSQKEDYQLNALKSIEGLENLNTADVTDMIGMFNGCSALTAINLLGFKTEKVMDMSGMFRGCSSLTSLTLSSFNTDNVKSMNEMFKGCSSLISLDLSSFNTAKVTDMDSMFGGCTALKSLNLRNFTVVKLVDAQNMFTNCVNLTTIYCDSNWSRDSYADNDMFKGCSKLRGGRGTICDGKNHIDMSYARPDFGAVMPGYFTSDIELPKMVYTVLDESTGTLTYYYDDQYYTRTGLIDEYNQDYNLIHFESYGTKTKNITKAVIDKSMKSARLKTLYLLFSSQKEDYQLNALKSIEGLENLYTDNVDGMSSMFEGCSSLTSLDLSSFNTTNVLVLESTFKGCSALTSLNLSNFNTAKVKRMNEMFKGCSSLTTLDLSNFKTTNVEYMKNIFEGCSALTSLNIMSFTVENLHRAESMFANCGNLTAIICNSDWSTYDFKDDDMFKGCNKLVGGKGSACDGKNHIDKSYARPDGGPGHLGYFTYKVPTLVYSEFVESTGTVTYYYDDQMNSRTGVVEEYNFENTKIKEKHFSSYADKIVKIVINPSMKDAKLRSTSYMFRAGGFERLNALTSIEGLDNLNTEYVTDMSYMFQCPKLASLDLSHLNTSNVKKMNYMFQDCISLTSLDISNFDITKVETMPWMFITCKNLTTIYCNDEWNQSSVLKNSEGMFAGCVKLRGSKGTVYNTSYTDKTYARPDAGRGAPGYFTKREAGKFVYSVFDETTGTLTYYYDDKRFDEKERPGIKEDFDPSSAYLVRFVGYNDKVLAVHIDPSMKEAQLLSTSGMFGDLNHAKTIEGMENLNTAKVQNMSNMFYDCRVLGELDLSAFNTANVTNMSHMFYGCQTLKGLDLSSFNTANVTDMRSMFESCFSLEEIDLGSFQFAQLQDASFMFNQCGILNTIYCSVDWSSSAALSDHEQIFGGCSSLKGSRGTICDGEKNIDKSYARPDKGTERPGYFTPLTEEAIIDGINYLLDNKAHTATVIPLPEGKYEGNLIIPEKVTYYGKNYQVVGIGDNAFKECYDLISLTMESANPPKVGKDAFEGITNTLSVHVPDDSKLYYENTDGWKDIEEIHISAHVIDGICYELDPNSYFAKVVSLPNGKYKGNIIVPQEIVYEGIKYKVGSIGKYAFARCQELISVSLPSTIDDIAKDAFFANPALISININSYNKTYCDIGGVVYTHDKKTLLVYPTGRYGGYDVPEGVEKIVDHVFAGCDMKIVHLPSTLTEIGDFAFEDTPVKIVCKAETPPTLGEFTFYNVNKDIQVCVPESSFEAYMQADGWKEFTNLQAGMLKNVLIGDLYYDLSVCDLEAVIVGADGKLSGSLDISPTVLYQGNSYTVTAIGDRAFYLNNITGVAIPSTVISIGRYAFYGCQKLVDLTFDEGLKEIGGFAFAKCLDLEELLLPLSLTTIDEDAFAGTSVEDLYIPEGVTTLGNHAFEECRKLKWVEFYEDIQSMGNCVFMNDDQLLAVFMNGSTPPTLGENAFINCKNLKTIYVPCGSLDLYKYVWSQYAEYIKNEEFSYYYTITALPSEHGTVEVPTSTCYPYMTAIPDENYEFVQWTDGNTDNPRLMEQPSQNETYEAVFGLKYYKWIVESNNDEWGYVSTPQTSITYYHGTEMIAIAVPKDGYKFIKWNDGYMNTPYNITLTQDTYLRAIFVPENEEPDIPQFTMQVTAAKVTWILKNGAHQYALEVFMDEACTQLFGIYLFDKNGYIIDVALAPKAPSRNWKEDQETEFQYNITGLTPDTKYFFRMKTTDEEGKLIYTDEGDFRTLNSAVYVVIQHIDAIGEVTYTSSCATNIELARESYDALSEEDKALVANYNTLVEAEKRYAELEAAAQAAALADAKDQLSDMIAQLQILQQIAQEYGMTEIAETIGAAITAATDVLNGDAVSISDVTTAMWNAIMALEDAKDALVLVAQDQFKQQLDQLLLPDDSEACILIIENAKAAVDELCLDPEKSLAENVEALMLAGQEIFEQAQQDLADQRAQDQPQGIITVEPQNTCIESRKILRNGMLIIERNGKMYNAQGIVIQ